MSAQGFWGPRVLPLLDFLNAPYPAPSGRRFCKPFGFHSCWSPYCNHCWGASHLLTWHLPLLRKWRDNVQKREQLLLAWRYTGAILWFYSTKLVEVWSHLFNGFNAVDRANLTLKELLSPTNKTLYSVSMRLLVVVLSLLEDLENNFFAYLLCLLSANNYPKAEPFHHIVHCTARKEKNISRKWNCFIFILHFGDLFTPCSKRQPNKQVKLKWAIRLFNVYSLISIFEDRPYSCKRSPTWADLHRHHTMCNISHFQWIYLK